MKNRSALLSASPTALVALGLVGITVSGIALSGCDGTTSPTPITIRDTVRIHDTTYLNDRFAKTFPILHGQWKFTTHTDTGYATLLQIQDTVNATITWKNNTSKVLRGYVSTRGSIDFSDSAANYQISANFTDSADHKITKLTGSSIDILKWKAHLGAAEDSIWAVRTF